MRGWSFPLGRWMGVDLRIHTFFLLLLGLCLLATNLGNVQSWRAIMLWLILLFSAQIVFGGLIGRWILGPTEDKWGRVGRMALGMAIIGVVVPLIHYVHILDLIFRLAAMTWGFGAIALALYKRVATPSIPIPPPMA